ncbi:MAG: Inner membrane protein YdgC [Candidatus Erwinia impunctatus]|nr:Inner membrane protein YdgC [Culicoides impunctatus]
MALLFKAFLGALAVMLIGLLSNSRHYVIAGLVPLFPTFALIAHYIVGSERGIEPLRQTLFFGMWAMIPYFIYLLSLWFFIGMMRLPYALLAGVVCWSAAAWLLILFWGRYFTHQ